jgi:hypothetical protein
MSFCVPSFLIPFSPSYCVCSVFRIYSFSYLMYSSRSNYLHIVHHLRNDFLVDSSNIKSYAQFNLFYLEKCIE